MSADHENPPAIEIEYQDHADQGPDVFATPEDLRSMVDAAVDDPMNRPTMSCYFATYPMLLGVIDAFHTALREGYGDYVKRVVFNLPLPTTETATHAAATSEVRDHKVARIVIELDQRR